MARSETSRLLAITGATLAASCAIAVGCSLGLDPNLMPRSSAAEMDAGVTAKDAAQRDSGGSHGQDLDAGTPFDAPTVRATDSASGIDCASDQDCASTVQGNACVTSSRCDPTWHVCLFDVCNGSCAVASCDLLSKQCAASTELNFTISVFPVSGGIGGLGPGTALAAAYPFLFVLTTSGVVAFNVANPTGNVPPMVTVHGLSFIPSALVAAGRRVYFVSGVEGAGPTYRQAIAWVDVPGNPFLTSLQASSAFIATTQQTLTSVFVAEPGGLDLVYASSYEPTATLAPPIADGAMVVPAPIGALVQGAQIVSVSGPQLVAYRYAPSTRHPNFALVSGVAQNSGQATPERAIASYGAVDDQASFVSGGDATLLWESAPLRASDAGKSSIAAARLTWLEPNADGGLFDTSVHADLETYSPARGVPVVTSGGASVTVGQVVGPAVWLDANTSVALAATAEDPNATSVQVFDRTTGRLVAGRRGVIPQPPWAVWITASNRFAYVLAPDDASNRSAKVYVLAPGCPGASVEPDDAGPVDSGSARDGGIGRNNSNGFVILR